MSGHNRFNPIAPRKAKIAYNFGLSESNRVKEGPFMENYHKKTCFICIPSHSLFTECTFARISHRFYGKLPCYGSGLLFCTQMPRINKVFKIYRGSSQLLWILYIGSTRSI